MSVLSHRWGHAPNPAACRDTARRFGRTRGPAAVESAQAHRPPHGRACRRYAAYAASGIRDAMPNPGLCRIDVKGVRLALSS